MSTDTVARLPALRSTEGAEACLVFVEGASGILGHRVPLAAEIVIGRDPTCTVRLDADDVSRRHAHVAPDGDGHVVGDLGSLNGTWVNGREIERRRLVSGDRIRFGPYVAKYLAAGDGEAAYHAELHRRATTDELTGLPNRGTFEGWLEREVAGARRDPRPLSLLLLDVDHFKRVNDARGHVAGDRVLREVARRMRDTLRGGDLLARVGGEEFCVLLPGADLVAAAEVGERLREAVRAAPVTVGDVPLAVTISAGAATFGPGDDEASLMARADARLYEAKRAGRDRVRV
ncbi:MAG TPA: GGDEF domain-containing protein [Anaeromyxobacteraceae bacterium]|nr:GGDEF domain-containing protein [Anaeromyxobacteraceae bacterium]